MALDSVATAGPSPIAAFSSRPMPPDGLLAADRLLTGANALFVLVRRVLDTVAGRACWAQTQLDALARHETPAENRADALLRYRQLAEDIRASLAATEDIGRSLVGAEVEDAFGLAPALDLLPRITACLPPVPPDADAAQEGLLALGRMLTAIAQAQAQFASTQDGLSSRVAMQAAEAAEAEAEAEPSLLEDADQRKEASRLQALQVRQQLAGYAIGLRAVRPRCLEELDEG